MSLYEKTEAESVSYILFEYVLGLTRADIICRGDDSLEDDQLGLLFQAYDRLVDGEPVQYVVGKADFYGRDFNVGPDVLIPRDETELLCRTVCNCINPHKSNRILDLCTGSGCIAWTLALETTCSEVVAVDISDGALNLASTQFQGSVESESSPKFLKKDVLKDDFVSLGQFDVIVSNPPYVRDSEKSLMQRNVLNYEPHLALFVSDDDPLLFYRAVADISRTILKSDGFGMVEINEAFGRETSDVFKEAGFESVTIVQDLNGKDRFVLFAYDISDSIIKKAKYFF